MPVQAIGHRPSGARVESLVEALCQQGCDRVRGIIATLERGGDLPEIRDLSQSERHALHAELVSIMAVYGNACRIG